MQGPYASFFTTPSFHGTLTIDTNGIPVAVKANATFLQPMPLQADVVVISPGLLLLIDVLQPSATADVIASVRLQGAVQIGDETLGFPDLLADGNVSASGDAKLRLQSASPWTPVPALMSSFAVPQAYGQLDITSLGELHGVSGNTTSIALHAQHNAASCPALLFSLSRSDLLVLTFLISCCI